MGGHFIVLAPATPYDLSKGCDGPIALFLLLCARRSRRRELDKHVDCQRTLRRFERKSKLADPDEMLGNKDM
jgi:hypothetical protein